MLRNSFCLLLALAALMTSSFAFNQIPSLVYPGGWPAGAKGNVMSIHAARMTTALEGEFLFLIDDKLYLSARAGRFEQWRTVGTSVGTLALLPDTGGRQKIVAVSAGELVEIRWDASQSNPVVQTSLVGSLPDWDGVTRLWVQERAGTQRIYGYDPGEGEVLRADHQNGVWISKTALGVAQSLRDLAFVEMDATEAGEELVFLFSYFLEIQNDAGTNTLSKVPAKSTDAIGVFRNNQATGGDLLLWSHQNQGVYELKAWNETVTSNVFPIGSDECQAIETRVSSLYGDHLLLTRGGVGDVDLVQILPGATSAEVSLARHAGGDTLDTHPDNSARPVRLSATGDFDMDGEDDLVVAVDGANGWELNYVMTQDVHEQTPGWLTSAGITYSSLGNDQHRLDLPMTLGTQMASSTVLLEIWAHKDPSDPSTDLVLLGSNQIQLATGATSYTFQVEFDAAGWDETEGHVYVSLAPVSLDSSSNITAVHPSRSVAWSHATATLPVVAGMPDWLNGTGPTSERPTHRPRPEVVPGSAL